MLTREQEVRRAREWLANAENTRYFAVGDEVHRATIFSVMDAAEPQDPPEMLSEAGVLDFLRFEVGNAGGQKEWALAHGVSPQLVNDVLRGRRAPAEKICEALGLVRVTSYRRVRPAK